MTDEPPALFDPSQHAGAPPALPDGYQRVRTMVPRRTTQQPGDPVALARLLEQLLADASPGSNPSVRLTGGHTDLIIHAAATVVVPTDVPHGYATSLAHALVDHALESAGVTSSRSTTGFPS